LKESEMLNTQKIGVIGGGTMGSGIAQVFAMAGYPVLIQDLTEAALDRSRTTIGASLLRLVKKGALTEAKAAEAMALIQTTTVFDLMDDRDLVVEAIVEKVEVKADLS
jgi:3-hydroxybutyryl-CoA dehydrogenase